MVVVFNLLGVEGAMLQLLLLVLLQLRRPLRVRPAEEITIIHENENEIHERKIMRVKSFLLCLKKRLFDTED